jgi:Uma2 family endonuclease
MSTATEPVPPPAEESVWPRPWEWTRDQYHHLGDLGVFDRPYGRRRVELLWGEIWEQHHDDRANPAPRLFPFTRDHLLTIAEAGLFDCHRVELVGGIIYLMSPIKEPHVAGVILVSDCLRLAFGAGYTVRTQSPLDIGTNSNPEPDVAVVAGQVRGRKSPPTSALIVVEVADTTLTHDTTTKVEDYAAAGIADYWVLDLTGDRLLVFRDPQPISAGGHTYRSRLILGPADSVSPLAAPAASIKVADLLP